MAKEDVEGRHIIMEYDLQDIGVNNVISQDRKVWHHASVH